MIVKGKSRKSLGPVQPSPPKVALFAPPKTTEDRLVRMRELGQRVDGYIQFMCTAAQSHGASLEAKEKAVTSFYDCLQVMEQRLAHIQNELRLE